MSNTVSGSHMQDRQAHVQSRNHLPTWLWLLLPPAVLAAIFISRYVDTEFYIKWVDSELGLIENLTPFMLAIGVASGLLLIRHRSALPEAWVFGWFMLHALGCFYFAGEEISWGQHWFGWGTPEQIGALNDQNETNLHNMTSWLDQKPRLLLVFWAVLGGVGAPVLLAMGKLKIGGYEDWRYWVFPPIACLPAGLIVMVVRLPEEIYFAMDRVPPFPFDVRASEVQELFLSFFLCFYMLSVYRRAARRAKELREKAQV